MKKIADILYDDLKVSNLVIQGKKDIWGLQCDNLIKGLANRASCTE